MGIRIQRVGSEQVGSLRRFVEEADEEMLGHFRYFQKRAFSVIQQHLVTFLAMDGERPVGYGHLDQEGEVIWLGIAVHSDHQGEGIGKRIMEELDREAKDRGLKRIRLSVDEGNEEAKGLYERFGFEEVEQKEGIVFMEKKLF